MFFVARLPWEEFGYLFVIKGSIGGTVRLVDCDCVARIRRRGLFPTQILFDLQLEGVSILTIDHGQRFKIVKSAFMWVDVNHGANILFRLVLFKSQRRGLVGSQQPAGCLIPLNLCLLRS